jgi:hypothetical protein
MRVCDALFACLGHHLLGRPPPSDGRSFGLEDWDGRGSLTLGTLGGRRGRNLLTDEQFPGREDAHLICAAGGREDSSPFRPLQRSHQGRDPQGGRLGSGISPPRRRTGRRLVRGRRGGTVFRPLSTPGEGVDPSIQAIRAGIQDPLFWGRRWRIVQIKGAPPMVRRGSTVRVRQRASVIPCSAAGSVVAAGVGRRLRRPRSVHQRPPWPLSRAELVEQADRVLSSVAREVTVRSIMVRLAPM